MPRSSIGRALEGLTLIVSHWFTLGLFSASVLYKMIATIMDYQLQRLAKVSLWHGQRDTTASFAAFMGSFGLATNTLSLVFSLAGTSCVIRRLGLRFALIAFPLSLCTVCTLLLLRRDVWLLFWMMVVIKALSYTLSSPAREMLYTVTSDTIKFKAKSWIDVFGGHGAKAGGALITHTLHRSLDKLLLYGTSVSLLAALVLCAISSWLANAFDRQRQLGQIIGVHDPHASRALLADPEREERRPPASTA